MKTNVLQVRSRSYPLLLVEHRMIVSAGTVDVGTRDGEGNPQKPAGWWTLVTHQRTAPGAVYVGRTWQNVPRCRHVCSTVVLLLLPVVTVTASDLSAKSKLKYVNLNLMSLQMNKGCLLYTSPSPRDS